MDAVIAGAQIAAVGMNAPPERLAAGTKHPHIGADAETVAARGAQSDLEPVTGYGGSVPEQPHGAVIVGDHNLDAAVIVEIAERGAAPYVAALESRPRCRRDLPEPAARALIMKKLIQLVE